MAKVIVSREARKDLFAIQMYIRDELLNPTAADRIPPCCRRAAVLSTPGQIFGCDDCRSYGIPLSSL
jgi:hypothetical protein